MTNSSKNKDITAINRREVEKGVDIYKDRPYIEENRILKNIAVFTFFVCSFFSWITQLYGLWFLSFLFLSSFLYTQIALGGAVALAIVAASLIEILKNIVVHRFFKSFFNSEKDTNWIVFLFMIVMFSISLGFSFWSSLYIPNVVAEQPTLVDVTKIEKEFDAHIEDLKKQRDLHRKDRLYKNRLASDDSQAIKEYNKDIKKEKEAKKLALEAAQNTNNTAVSNWATANNTAGQKIGWVMVVLEFLVVGAVAYYFYYYWQAAAEGSPSPTTPIQRQIKKNPQRIPLDDDDDIEAEQANDSHDNGLTSDSTGLDLDSSTSPTGIADVEYVEIMDNEKVDLVKRVKDAISKNYQRSFTSSTPEARKANAEKLKERAEFLKKEFGIKCHFDDTNKKVLFSNTKTA